jgi:hypothetical protein
MKLSGFDTDWFRALFALGLAGVLSTTLSNFPLAAAENFPFNDELLLDTEPMRGSKRVPCWISGRMARF